jgi:hypothetical protein
MSSPSTEFHKIWIEQCAATEAIRERFGLESASDYLIGEKIFNFVMAAERDPDFAADVDFCRSRESSKGASDAFSEAAFRWKERVGQSRGSVRQKGTDDSAVE